MLTIASKRVNAGVFELQKVTQNDMIKEIVVLNPRKAVSEKIPIKALKAAMFECTETLTDIFNKYIVEFFSSPKKLKSLLKLFQLTRKTLPQISPTIDQLIRCQ